MSKQKLFIGISGKMGTGKSTITNILLEAIDNSGKISMSSPIYKAQDLLYEEYGLTLSGEKDRALLIAIGMWGRDRDSDFWLNQAVSTGINNNNEVVICDDVRFPNEANFFKKHGVLVRIEGKQRGDNVDHSKATDPTECALDDYDFEHVLSNKLSPEDICKKIANIMLGK